MPEQALSARLEEGIRALGQDPAAHPCAAYLAYIDLLVRWNRAYNLSGIRTPGRILTHHVLDSLAVGPFVHGRRCLDLGSGAGLPGLLLALALPDTHWVLLDSNLKKARFLNHAVMELAPGNCEVVTGRMESYRPPAPLETVTCRAFATLARCWRLTRPHLAPEGCLLALKGQYPGSELDAMRDEPVSARVHALSVPGIEAPRHLVVLSARPAA